MTGEQLTAVQLDELARPLGYRLVAQWVPAGPFVTVAGFCPMGCGQTLFLNTGGHVTCSLATCPHPSAVSDLIANPDTDHVADIEADGFAIRHPLRERLTPAGSDHEGLFDCGLFSEIAAGDGPPVPPGRYRVPDDLDQDGRLVFVPLDTEPAVHP